MTDGGMGPVVGDPEFLVPEAEARKWAEHTYSIRGAELVLGRVPDPKPGSPFSQVDVLYPYEKVSVWARAYLKAAAEHLGLWANTVAPYSFPEGHINDVRIRPYLLLARAGLEAAAHAIWLLDCPQDRSFEGCVQRYVRLMHRDFCHHRNALIAGAEETGHIDKRITDLESRVLALPFETAPRNKPPGYENLVRHAAEVSGNDADHWAYLWHAASGAGHGQNWFSIEGFDIRPVAEYEPGHYRAIFVPDPSFVTEAVEAAASALTWGTCRWLQWGDHSPDLIRQALPEIFERMPKKEASGSQVGFTAEDLEST